MRAKQKIQESRLRDSYYLICLSFAPESHLALKILVKKYCAEQGISKLRNITLNIEDKMDTTKIWSFEEYHVKAILKRIKLDKKLFAKFDILDGPLVEKRIDNA